MKSVLITIIKASERAANVARSCCVSESTKEGLFISEKHEGEANARFEKDFKTIADVLAQESARDEISAHSLELAKYFRGEESSEIGGVTIAIKENADATAEILSLLVPQIAAKRMAEAAHANVYLDICDKLPQSLPDINMSDLGFWIDPIDATAEFIAGVQGKSNANKGLTCVTVLIGAYLRSTGEPIIGVINQPFYDKGKGRITWGVSYNGVCEWGGYEQLANETNVVLISGGETAEIVEKIKNAGWETKALPGAGNKLLKVVTGEAAAYIVSKGTTFRWDTCGPHAILKAMGGNLLKYTLHAPVTYNDPENIDTQLYCNSEGIIAYTNKEVFKKLKDILN